jgi:hypothetical protein
MDEFFQQHGGELLVYALNDRPVTLLHTELQDLRVTRTIAYDGHRLRFVRAALRASFSVEAIFYGLVGFAPLVLFRCTPHASRLLLIYGVEVRQRHPVSIAQRFNNVRVISISEYT